MRNYEVFNNREAILERLEELKSEGISEAEIEVFNSSEEEQEYLRGLGLEIYREDDGFVPLFTKEPSVEELDRYNLTRGDLEEARGDIEAGRYILHVNRLNYYEDYYGEDDSLDNIHDKDYIEDNPTMILHEERLRVSKDRVKTGEVKISKSTITEDQEFDVDYEKDDVIVRRVAPGVSDSEIFGDDFIGEVTRIPVYGEKIIITKEKVLEEEIVILKKSVTNTEKIVEPVRREVVEILDENK